MNNLLFSALAIALIYYFFFYLPHQKKISHPSFTNQATQTRKEVADQEVQTSLAVENKETQTEKDEQITDLKKQLQSYKDWGKRFINSHEIVFGTDMEGSNCKNHLITLLVYSEKLENNEEKAIGINFRNVEKLPLKLFKEALVEYIYEYYQKLKDSEKIEQLEEQDNSSDSKSDDDNTFEFTVDETITDDN